MAADTTGNAVTSDQVIHLISDEYNSCMMKKGKNGPDEAFTANSQKQRNKHNVECYNCHNFGHYKSDSGQREAAKKASILLNVTTLTAAATIVVTITTTTEATLAAIRTTAGKM